MAGEFGLGTAQRNMVDGYVDHATAAELIERYFLIEDTQGNVTLRITDDLPDGDVVADTVTVAPAGVTLLTVVGACAEPL